jgi:uncharacterized protein YciI
VITMLRARHALTALLAALALSWAASPAAAQASGAPAFDAEMAKAVAADDYGMRRYVLVILKTGPTPLPAGPQRDEVFKGHFANMSRLAAEGKLAFAGPLDGVDGRRGIFVMAVPDIEEAKKLAATDPVLASGEMVAEYHRLYGSAALMLVNEQHKRVQKRSF